MSLEAVGAPVIIVALVAEAFDKDESHSKQAPLTINAINLSPKLSKDQSPGSATLSVVDAA